MGVELVLPSTALMEFERHHAQIVKGKVDDLMRALNLLDTVGINHDDVTPEGLIRAPDIEELLLATGVPVSVIPPGTEDFEADGSTPWWCDPCRK